MDAANFWRKSLAFEPMVPDWALIVLVVTLALVAGLLWRASGTLAGRQRSALTILRAVLLVGLLITLMGPVLRHERIKPVPGTVLVLVDRSASMDLPSRRSHVERLMSPQELAGLQERFSLLQFSFADQLEPFDSASLKSAPEGKGTRILNALEEAVAAVEGSPLAGIALITDGVNQEVAEGLEGRVKALGAPLFILTPGAQGARDLALSAADEAPLAFVRNSRSIKVQLTGRGVDGMEATIKVEAPGMPVQLRKAKLVGDPAQVEIELPFKPMRVGRQVLRISTPLIAGEQDESNNTLLLPMDVVRDRLRVLLVAGAPTWDVRFLRRLLKEDPGVDLVSFFILRTPEDSNQVPENELSLIPFPERELFEQQLHTFDVVLFVDFNFAPYSVGQYLGHIRRFVEDEGGGFAMIGGERSFFEGQYQDTEIGRLLPVEIAPQTADIRPFVPLVLAPEHPILSLGWSGDLQDKMARLPLLRGRNRLGDPKPGASVILAHPDHSKDRPEPVLVAAPVGRGRVLALAVDSLWRWQLPASAKQQKARPYYRIWHNMLRWLSGDPAFSRLAWEELPSELSEGQELNLSLRLRGEDWQAQAGATIVLKVSRAGVHQRKLSATTDQEGRVRFELGKLEAGDWTLNASARLGAIEVARSEAVVIAGQPSPERRLVGPDLALSQRLARASGGRVYDWKGKSLAGLPFDASRRGERVEAMRHEPIWNHPIWMLFILLPGLLAVALRRRWQLV